MLICFRGRVPKTGRPGQEDPGHLEYVIEEHGGDFRLRIIENTNDGKFSRDGYSIRDLIENRRTSQGFWNNEEGNLNNRGFFNAVLKDFCDIVKRLDETRG